MPMRHVAFRVTLFFCALIIAVTGFTKLSTASGISNQMYLSLIEGAKAQSEGYNFRVLRGTYVQTDYYKPATTRPAEDLPLILEQIEKNEPGAEDYLHNYIGNNFPLPEVHTQLVSWYERKGDKEKAAYHTWMANGLLNAILKHGDGLNTDTAYPIINRGEISIVMEMKQMSIEATRQRVIEDGRIVEAVKGKNPENGAYEEVWFDITATQINAPMSGK
jgi:hypothetical protein